MSDNLNEIIEKSTMLPRMKVMLGVDYIKQDTERRMRILKHTHDQNITGVSEIHDAINGFYHAPEQAHSRTGFSSYFSSVMFIIRPCGIVMSKSAFRLSMMT